MSRGAAAQRTRCRILSPPLRKGGLTPYRRPDTSLLLSSADSLGSGSHRATLTSTRKNRLIDVHQHLVISFRGVTLFVPPSCCHIAYFSLTPVSRLLKRHRGKRLRFSSSIQNSVKESEAVFITVGTPQGESGEPDLSYVESVEGFSCYWRRLQGSHGRKISSGWALTLSLSSPALHPLRAG